MMIDIENQLNNIRMKNLFRTYSIILFLCITLKSHADSKNKYNIKMMGEKYGYYEFEISNNSLDSVFLFSTYICPSYYDIIDEYSILYRYDTAYNKCKLSFLPIITSLHGGIVYGRKKNIYDNKRIEVKTVHHPTNTYQSWLWNDPFGERIYRYNINVHEPTSDIADISDYYELIAIPPQSNHTVKIHKKAFYNAKVKYIYLQEIYPKTLSLLDTLVVTPYKKVQCNELLLEFALYKDIDLLLSPVSSLFEEYNYNKEALSFEIITVKIDLHGL